MGACPDEAGRAETGHSGLTPGDSFDLTAICPWRGPQPRSHTTTHCGKVRLEFGHSGGYDPAHDRAAFPRLFVFGPLLLSSILPTLFFGLLLGQWGSNLLWGSYFGLGWCLAAFASGNILHDGFSTAVGFAWGWLALVPLYVAAGALWRSLADRGRRTALLLLGLSSLASLPAGRMMELEGYGVHLPDYGTHLIASY